MNPIYWIGHSLAKLFGKCFLSMEVVNPERLENIEEGGLLIASNHVSFLDPPLVGSAFKEPLYYFARKTLFKGPVSNWILEKCQAIPVDQDKPELSTMKRVIQLVKKGEKVVIFPEGSRSWDGVLAEEGQPGVGMIVAKSKSKVLPVRLFGPEKALPRGAKFPQKTKGYLVIGEIMDLSETIDSDLPTKEKYQLLSNQVMAGIAKLNIPS